MDVDEWEFLPDSGYLDFNEEGDKKIFLGKRNLESKSDFDMDYFCPSPPSSRKITEPPRSPRFHNNQLLPVPILLEPRIGKDITKNHPMEVTTVVAPSAATEKIKASDAGASVASDHDTVSQVFFKIKENEFVDMKMDSPRSSSRGLLPPADTGALKFEDKGEAMEMITSPRMKIEKDVVSMDCDEEEDSEDSTWEEGNTGGFNFWKWGLTGVGAICSFGVAAATICILFFGGHQKRNKLQQDQKIRFQIYTDDKVSKFLSFLFFGGLLSTSN